MPKEPVVTAKEKGLGVPCSHGLLQSPMVPWYVHSLDTLAPAMHGLGQCEHMVAECGCRGSLGGLPTWKRVHSREAV